MTGTRWLFLTYLTLIVAGLAYMITMGALAR